jgi:hypothetical protein
MSSPEAVAAPTLSEQQTSAQSPQEKQEKIIETLLDDTVDGVPREPDSAANTNLNPLYELAKKRLNAMYLTKGARFEASRRHKKAGRTSTLAIVILSTYIFGISVISLTYKNEIKGDWESILKSVSLIMSFFVVAFSLLQSSYRHDLRSELFLKCANAIDDLWTELCRDKALGTLSAAKLKSYDDDYRRVITNFSDNHSDLDFHIFRFNTSENPKHKSRFERIWAGTRRIYWHWKLHFYIWKNVYVATLFPWLIILGFVVWRYKVPLMPN